MNSNSDAHASTAIVWFGNDLRVTDHPALSEAVARHTFVIPLYIWSEDSGDPWPLGGASKWWLNHSLTSLAKSLDSRGSKLIIRRGAPLFVLREIAQETGARHLYCHDRYEPHARSELE